MFGLVSAWVVGFAVAQVPEELGNYVSRADKAYSWSISSREEGRLDLRLVSQGWKGAAWVHSVVTLEPNRLRRRGAAVLIVTGGKPNAADLRFAKQLADLVGVPVSTLFDIPNQPLWGRREDDLIAHTFERFLETGEPDWPLLFPMVKSVARCMDALADSTSKSKNPLRRFVVTGASKRGWTTWLTAALGDKRVVGIAPMVFDNLGFRDQLDHQLKSWGRYSEMIADYTDRGLQDVLDTPIGKRLVRLVDPISYLPRIQVPTLIVNGSNDRYWTADATRRYWAALKQPKRLLVVPNAGHDLGDGRMVLETLAAFADWSFGGPVMPTVSFTVSPGSDALRFEISATGRGEAALAIWGTESNTLDFRSGRWRRVATISAGSRSGASARVLLSRPKGNAAYFVEARWNVTGREFSACAPTWVIRAEEGR